MDLAGVEPASRMPSLWRDYNNFFISRTANYFFLRVVTLLAIALTVFGLGGFLPFKIWLTLRGLGILTLAFLSCSFCGFFKTLFCNWSCHFYFLFFKTLRAVALTDRGWCARNLAIINSCYTIFNLSFYRASLLTNKWLLYLQHL